MKTSTKIGSIEFVGDEVRLAVIKTGGKLPTVLELHTAKAIYGQEDQEERHNAFVHAVKEVVNRVKNRPALYVLSASSEWSIVRLIRAPFKGRRRVGAAIRFELEPYLAIPIEELVIDFLPVRELDGETEVLAVGMRSAHIAEQVAILEGAGVNVEGIGIDAAGQTALWQGQKKGLSGLNAVLHLRKDSAILAVVHGKRLAYFRYMAIGAAQFHENPLAAAKEINNILRAFLSQWTEKLLAGETKAAVEISALTITGVQFFEEERVLFEEHLTVPVSHEDIFSKLKGANEAFVRTRGSGQHEEGQEYGAADGGLSAAEKNGWLGPIGVADSAAGGPYSLNFRKQELGNGNPLKSLVPHIVFSACLALIALVGYATYCFVDYKRNTAELDRVGKEVWKNFATAFPEHEVSEKRPSQDLGGIRTYAIMTDEMENGESLRESLSAELFNRPTLLDILAEIARKMPDDKVSINEIRVGAGRFAEITISGQVKDPLAFDAVFADLQKSRIFEVQVSKLKRTLIGGRESFVIFAKQ